VQQAPARALTTLADTTRQNGPVGTAPGAMNTETVRAMRTRARNASFGADFTSTSL
jgi:hypothetical protein